MSTDYGNQLDRYPAAPLRQRSLAGDLSNGPERDCGGHDGSGRSRRTRRIHPLRYCERHRPSAGYYHPSLPAAHQFHVLRTATERLFAIESAHVDHACDCFVRALDAGGVRSKPAGELGGTDCRRLCSGPSEVCRNVRSAVRNRREAWAATAAGYGFDQRPVDRRTGRRARVFDSLSRVLFRARYSRRVTNPEHWLIALRFQLELLQETTDEMGRNGCRKMLIVNGARRQQQPAPLLRPDATRAVATITLSTSTGLRRVSSGPSAHAYEDRWPCGRIGNVAHANFTSGTGPSGPRQIGRRLRPQPPRPAPSSVYTGIWWYAKFP